MEHYYIKTYTGINVDNDLWIASVYTKRFYKVDTETYKSTIVDCAYSSIFPDCKAMVRHAFAYNDILFFFVVPDLAYYKYTLDSNLVDFVLREKDVCTSQIIRISEKELFILSTKPWEKSWIFNMQTEEFRKITSNADCIKTIIDKVDNPLVQSGCLMNNQLWMPICFSPYYLTMSLADFNFRIHKLDKSSLGTVCCLNNRVYINDLSTADVWVISANNQIEDKFTLTCNSSKDKTYAFFFPIESKYICFLPQVEGMDIVLYDVNSKKQTIYGYPSGFEISLGDFNNTGLVFYGSTVRDGKAYVYPLSGNMLLIIDPEKNAIEGKAIAYPDDQSAYIVMRDKSFLREIIFEGQDASLMDYLGFVELV